MLNIFYLILKYGQLLKKFETYHYHVQFNGNIVPHHLIDDNYTQSGILYYLFKIKIIIQLMFILNET